MSVVTLEQQTVAVMTELADEEISGIVGGYKSIFKPETKIKSEAEGKNVISTIQVGNAYATGGGDAVVKQDSYSEINNSKNKVRIFGY
ncbi:MAG: hypothetical protein V7L13_25650 [Nostoc sp.]|uniref:hypothetical protein n=1 Tax=Nostoc sp. TaxID=1180 RepID=UPI002FFD2B71